MARGDSMESSFEVDRAGTYDLAVQLTLAGDYGIFRMNLPGTGVSRTIDLYSPRGGAGTDALDQGCAVGIGESVNRF